MMQHTGSEAYFKIIYLTFNPVQSDKVHKRLSYSFLGWAFKRGVSEA